ncbi:MAG: hypothetical protein EXR79_12110 [Myxococcales bacterium]|nr:hypothetical protein [Myxococcales bacterium]
MQKELKAAGIDVPFVVVNVVSGTDSQANLIDVCDLPLLQDTDAVKAWDVHGAAKDDVAIYTAQGKLWQWFPFGGVFDTNFGNDANYSAFKAKVVEATQAK